MYPRKGLKQAGSQNDQDGNESSANDQSLTYIGSKAVKEVFYYSLSLISLHFDAGIIHG